MIYVYLVVGCWLKFVYPETAELTDAIWQGCAWGFTGASVFIALWLVFADKTEGTREIPDTSWTKVAAIGFAGLLTGHPLTTFALLASYCGFRSAHNYRQKALAKK